LRPQKPFFVGWQNQYNVINAMLAAAAEKELTVFELDFEQELNLVEFTAQARFIVDNAHGDSGQPNVRDALRYYMGVNGFLPGRVTWSAVAQNATVAGANCTNVYTDYARLMALDAVASAIGGGYIGRPLDASIMGGLICAGSVDTMFPFSTYGTQPNIVDVHLYPCVDRAQGVLCYATEPNASVQSESKIHFDNLVHHLNLLGVQSSVVVLGEVHSNSSTPLSGQTSTCEGVRFGGIPTTAAASTVAGYNQSSLTGQGVVFRPWANLASPSGDCFTYPSNQRVNYLGGGPYTPTQP
jgi:hypothetical protein